MSLEAYILIGGRSRRFGSDKAFAEIDGVPMAERAAATLAEAFPGAPIAFIASSETQFDRSLTDRLSFPVAADIIPGYGAWSGLHAALSHAKADNVFVMACDMPYVDAAAIKMIAGSLDVAAAAVPRQSDGRIQPLCAAYRRKICAPVVEGLIREGVKAPPLVALFESVETRIVDLSVDATHFLNLNTPRDLSDAIGAAAGL